MLFYIYLFRALSALNKLHNGGSTDENVYNPFNLWPCAKSHVNNVQVLTKKAADTNETPVKSSDDDQPVT